MDAEPDVARVARTIGDPTRIRMLTLLMEGRALTAKELAHGTAVEPATATSHLRRLVDDALVLATAQGRHKYFRLASVHVAECVEALLALAVPRSPTPRDALQPIHQARFCYDHLAGRLGVEITAAMVEQKILRADGKSFVLSPKGEHWFSNLGVKIEAVRTRRRVFACACLDWSERKDHLGGALGAAFAEQLLQAGWLKRKTGTRVAIVTALGSKGLAQNLGVKATL
ncbi:MAG: winged helix-turn-helix domain-containing protein [Opitutus sp.]